MIVAMYSNYLTPHQLPFCYEMIGELGEDSFFFIAEESFKESRELTGYSNLNHLPFVLRSYEGGAQESKARNLCKTADVAIVMCGSVWLEERIRSSLSVTFLYSERLLKRGLWFRYFPPKVYRFYERIGKYRHFENLHVLCASAFLPLDLKLFGFPIQNCWKWGYFPAFESGVASRSDVHNKRSTESIDLLWVGRMVDWKNPLCVVELVSRLRREGVDCRLKIAGDGPLRDAVASQISSEGVSEYAQMLGALPNDTVRELMHESDIFLMTSGRTEGWGAVLNEAMGCKCVPIASDIAGATPYLIKNETNGLVFHSGDDSSLYQQVSSLMGDPEKIEHFSTNAKSTIQDYWNPHIAAARLIQLANSVCDRVSYDAPLDGPCSAAGVVSENWFQKSRTSS